MSTSNAFSLEISQSAVKLLALTLRKKTEFVVTHASRHPYDSKTVLPDTLKRALHAVQIEGSLIATSVWASTMVIRKISLPRLKSQEIMGALQLEADKYVPFGLDECVLDHFQFPQDPQGTKTDVMLIACKKDLIAERCRLLEDAGLKLLFMDIHPVALVNWLLLRKPEASKGIYALIHICDTPGKVQGEDNFIVILRDGIPWVIRDLGDRFSTAEPTDEAFAQTAALIANAIVFFENLAHGRPKEILLSADDSVASKLGEAVEKATRLRPVRWSASDGLAFADEASKNAFASFPAQFSTSLGLSARALTK